MISVFLKASGLGNTIVAGANHAAYVDMFEPQIELTGPHSVLGRTIVLHAYSDDLGNAGARVACGIIQSESETRDIVSAQAAVSYTHLTLPTKRIV